VCQPEATLESVAAEEEDPLPFPKADIVEWFHDASGESMPCGDRVTLCQTREVTRTATKGEQLLRDDGDDSGLSVEPTGSQRQSNSEASEGPPSRFVMCSAFAPCPVVTDVHEEISSSTAPRQPDTGQIDEGIAPADLRGRPEA
jgi:hypothetical protein